MTGRPLLGIDISAGRIRALLVDGPTVVAELAEPTRQGSAREMVAQIVGLAARLVTHSIPKGGDLRSTVKAVGVSVPASVDPGDGRLGPSLAMPDMAGTELRSVLAAAFGIPVAVENDANVAALAEGRLGAAVGIDNYVVVVIREGIGMGIVLDGQLRHGWHGRAGEIARLPLGGEGVNSEQARSTDYESVVSGSAVRSRMARMGWAARSSRLAGARSLAEAVLAASQGDAPAVRMVREEARLIALGIASATAILDPELVVLAGETGSVPGLLVPVSDQLQTMVAEPPRLVTSALGDRGTLLGAVEIARIAADAAAEGS